MGETTLSRDVSTFIEALGDVIIAAHHLQSELLNNAGGVELERALVEFDKANTAAAQARWRCFGEPTYPALSLEEPVHQTV